MKRITRCASALVALAAATSVTAGVKWHPGHYVMLNGDSSEATHFSQIDEIASEPVIKGVQVRVWWYQIERSKGVYDFSRIDDYLRKLKSLPSAKRLVVRIMDRRFGTSSRSNIVPNYLLTESIYNGGVTASKNGYVARLWEAPVMDRLIALYRAVGARYDGDAYFEGVATEETTLGFGSKTPPASYSNTALTKQYQRFAAAARDAMPRTNLFLYTNFLGSDTLMADLIQDLVAPQLGAGGPNVLPSEMTQGQRVWTGQTGADYRGRLAIGNSVEAGELGGSLGNFTPKQIYDFAYNTLYVDHLFWVRNTLSGSAAQRWSTGILPFLKNNNPPTRTKCPAAYGICVN